MGRPKLGHTRKVVIDFETLDDLRLVAAMQGVPVSQVIRDALRAHVRRVLKGRRRAA